MKITKRNIAIILTLAIVILIGTMLITNSEDTKTLETSSIWKSFFGEPVKKGEFELQADEYDEILDWNSGRQIVNALYENDYDLWTDEEKDLLTEILIKFAEESHGDCAHSFSVMKEIKRNDLNSTNDPDRKISETFSDIILPKLYHVDCD